jgi:hypothetical protein
MVKTWEGTGKPTGITGGNGGNSTGGSEGGVEELAVMSAVAFEASVTV